MNLGVKTCQVNCVWSIYASKSKTQDFADVFIS